MRRKFVIVALHCRPATTALLADFQLETDTSDRLQDRVVQVGGELVSLPQRHLVVDRGIQPRSLLFHGAGCLSSHLPTQERHPQDRGQGHRPEDAGHQRQPRGRPPRRQSQRDDILRPAKQQRESLNLLPLGGDGGIARFGPRNLYDARHPHVAAGHDARPARRIGGRNDRGERLAIFKERDQRGGADRGQFRP